MFLNLILVIFLCAKCGRNISYQISVASIEHIDRRIHECYIHIYTSICSMSIEEDLWYYEKQHTPHLKGYENILGFGLSITSGTSFKM